MQSVAGATPVNANWGQAWVACRNSSNSFLATRLPTGEEWRRAAKWPADQYSSMWATYQGACNTGTGSAQSTGTNSACISQAGAVDMAGNMREWVDERIQAPPALTAPPARWGYTPTLGQLLANGLDGFTYFIHQLNPQGAASGTLALLMGSDFRASSSMKYNSTQSWSNFNSPGIESNGLLTAVDPETESWEDATIPALGGAQDTSRGFRCVGLLAANMPTLAQVALPSEPTYQSTDTIPANLFVGDKKPETITINGSASSGSVQIQWAQWTKGWSTGISATNESSTGFKY